MRRVDRHLSVSDQVAACFTDHRDPRRIQYSLRKLISQRILGIAQGYEDLNDHDQLRHDPLMALVSEKGPRGDSPPLAGKSTLNRLEHAPTQGPTRYHKIDHDPQALQSLLVKLFLQAHPHPPDEIILDLDATDDPLHGEQEDRFFHGYYKGYCYLPLYIFSGHHLLSALLRPANIDASAGHVGSMKTARQVGIRTGHSRTRAGGLGNASVTERFSVASTRVAGFRHDLSSQKPMVFVHARIQDGNGLARAAETLTPGLRSSHQGGAFLEQLLMRGEEKDLSLSNVCASRPSTKSSTRKDSVTEAGPALITAKSMKRSSVSLNRELSLWVSFTLETTILFDQSRGWCGLRLGRLFWE